MLAGAATGTDGRDQQLHAAARHAEEVAAQRDAAIAAGIDVTGPECEFPWLRRLKP